MSERAAGPRFKCFYMYRFKLITAVVPFPNYLQQVSNNKWKKKKELARVAIMT